MAAVYLYECWPSPEWLLVCSTIGRAVEDITCLTGEIKDAILSDAIQFWPTYDFLVEFIPKITQTAGADLELVRELLLYEFDDDFLYDLFDEMER